jgi:hypothetical protein
MKPAEFYQQPLNFDAFMEALDFNKHDGGAFYINETIAIAPTVYYLIISEGLPDDEDFREITISFPKTISDGLAAIKDIYGQEWDNESLISFLEEYIECTNIKSTGFFDILRRVNKAPK